MNASSHLKGMLLYSSVLLLVIVLLFFWNNLTPVAAQEPPSPKAPFTDANDHASVRSFWKPAGASPAATERTSSLNVEFVGQFDGASYAVAVQGDYAYITKDDSLRVVDISDPINPAEAGTYDDLDSVSDVAVAGDYAYLAAFGGLVIVDISNPISPTWAGEHYVVGGAYDVALAGNYAYVIDEWDGSLVVVDVSDPLNPIESGVYNTPGFSLGVAVAGNYAYVAGAYGLRVVDISDPTTPTEVGAYDTASDVWSVAVANDYAYVTGSSGGLVVVDVSDPTTPAKAGAYGTPGSTRSVAMAGAYAYVAGDNGLRVVDVSNPETPTEVGAYDTTGSGSDVVAVGDHAYVADGDSGLLILRYTGGTIGRTFLPLVTHVQPPEPTTTEIPCYYFPQDSSPDWYVQRCLPDGTYEIQRINVSYTQAWCACWYHEEHYALEVDARLVQGDADYRIFFDNVDPVNPENFYTFGVNPRQGTYSLMRVDEGGEWVTLIDWTSSPHILRDSAVNRLRVERNGDTITLAVNGEVLAHVDDNTYQGGEWGLYTRNYVPNSILHFENILMTEWPIVR